MSAVTASAMPSTCTWCSNGTASVADAVSALVVVGHNPTMAYLAQLLDDGEGDPAVVGELAGGFPTSAVAVFEYDGSWADLAEGSAHLVAFHVGRG